MTMYSPRTKKIRTIPKTSYDIFCIYVGKTYSRSCILNFIELIRFADQQPCIVT